MTGKIMRTKPGRHPFRLRGKETDVAVLLDRRAEALITRLRENRLGGVGIAFPPLIRASPARCL